jgi:hypothetical protein
MITIIYQSDDYLGTVLAIASIEPQPAFLAGAWAFISTRPLGYFSFFYPQTHAGAVTDILRVSNYFSIAHLLELHVPRLTSWHSFRFNSLTKELHSLFLFLFSTWWPYWLNTLTEPGWLNLIAGRLSPAQFISDWYFMINICWFI